MSTPNLRLLRSHVIPGLISLAAVILGVVGVIA